jgi:hypothetical protein
MNAASVCFCDTCESFIFNTVVKKIISLTLLDFIYLNTHFMCHAAFIFYEYSLKHVLIGSVFSFSKKWLEMTVTKFKSIDWIVMLKNLKIQMN